MTMNSMSFGKAKRNVLQRSPENSIRTPPIFRRKKLRKRELRRQLPRQSVALRSPEWALGNGEGCREQNTVPESRGRPQTPAPHSLTHEATITDRESCSAR